VFHVDSLNYQIKTAKIVRDGVCVCGDDLLKATAYAMRKEVEVEVVSSEEAMRRRSDEEEELVSSENAMRWRKSGFSRMMFWKRSVSQTREVERGYNFKT
jgi:hypothetical protein